MFDVRTTACYNGKTVQPGSAMPYYELTIAVSDMFREAVIRRLTDAGCLGVIEQDEAVIAYFLDTADMKLIENDLMIVRALLEKSGQPAAFAVHQRIIPDQDWNETWKEGFHAIDIGERFTILPPWEKKKTGRINLVIDPAMAFGTGHHETTRSCLVLMEKYVAKSGKERFLDVGTGTGILAIAASKLGFRTVTGVDTDILAVEAARENIMINQTPAVEIREGSLAELNEAYDFIAANIISGVLVLLAPALASLLKPGGIAVLSGILQGQEEEVITAMTQSGLKLIEQYPDNKWISLVVQN